MINKALKPKEPLISIQAAETIDEIFKDYEDYPGYKHYQRRNLYEGSLYSSDEWRDDQKKTCYKKHNADYDAEWLIQLIIDSISSEIGNTLDTDNNKKDTNKYLEDKIPAYFSCCHISTSISVYRPYSLARYSAIG